MLDEVIFVEFVAHVVSHLLSLPTGGHVNVVLSHFHCIHSLLVLLLDCSITVLNIFLMNSFLNSLLFHLLLLLLLSLILHKRISLLFVCLLKLKLLLPSSKNCHLAMSSNLLQFLLFVDLCLVELGVLLLLESIILIPHHLRLAIHDISFVRLHFGVVN